MRDMCEFTGAAPRPDELDEIDTLLTDLLTIQGRQATYWDADFANLSETDPAEAAWCSQREFEDGWDDPAEAAMILDQTMIDDARLTPRAETTTIRPLVRPVDAALIDEAWVSQEAA